jgi:hypothetical protein
MNKIKNPLHEIGELLSNRALPVIAPERLAPSAIYDLQYRMAVFASAFEIHAKPYAFGQRRIHSARLKLLQFIACRPWLVGMVRKWSEARYDAQLSLATSQRLRRGFLSDQMHEDVVAFLVARGVLDRSGAHLITSAHGDFLTRLHLTNIKEDLFSVERTVLKDLLAVQITNPMLEGW